MDDATSEYAVAAGYFVSATYLPEDPICYTEQPDGTILLCMDPPPMALRFRVSESLFGPTIPGRIITFTTSHFGKSGIDYGSDHPYLLLLITNGVEFITPRYHLKRLAFDSRDQLAAPIESPTDAIWWLPCSVSQPASDIRLVGPREAIQIEVARLPDDELRETRDFVRVRGDTATIKRGVYLKEVKHRLAGMGKAQIEAGCHI
jgi:hypothetical protein